MNAKLCLAGPVVLVYLFLARGLCAQDFLNAPPSPEANGRAGIYFSGDTDDPLAPLSNPALLGLMAERNHLMAAFYPQRANWEQLNAWGPASGGEYSSRAILVGYNRAKLGHSHFSLGLGYQEVYLDRYRAYDNTRGVSASAALHYREMQLAAGINFRSGANYTNVFDLGLFYQILLDRAFSERNLSYARDGIAPRPFGTLSIGYVMRNLGSTVPGPRTDEQTFVSPVPLPRRATLGFALQTGLHAAHPLSDDWQILSLSVGIEAEDNLVHYLSPFGYGGDWNYKGMLGNINPAINLILGKSDDISGLKKGFEFGLAEAVYLRWGSVADDGWYLGGSNTQGFGVHLAGFFKFATLDDQVLTNKISGYVARHIDIQYNQSTRHDHHPNPLDGLTYHELALLFKY
jgi:hypothetical protein